MQTGESLQDAAVGSIRITHQEELELAGCGCATRLVLQGAHLRTMTLEPEE